MARRIHVIKDLIDRYGYQSYLEIGVKNARLLLQVTTPVRVGVDPNSDVADYKMTSDEFFNVNTEKYDIIFIDGLHTGEQVYRDIYNSLNIISDGGTIVLHDCLPYTESYASPTFIPGGWSGTVYKGFIRAKKELKELSCFTINIDHGIGVITHNEILPNVVSDIEFNDWQTFYDNRHDLLQLVEYDEFTNLIK